MENAKAMFMLPGFYEHKKLYELVFKIFNTNPEFFRKEANIYCLYGNFPFCTWDGGRIFNSYQPAPKEEIEQLQNLYNNILNTKIRFVFTNSLLEQKDCYDRYNNLSLEIFNNGQNEIVVNSPILEDYLMKNYPNYSFISSTTKCITDITQAQEELNKTQYKFVCLDYNLNHNFSLLDSLSKEEKEKVEFLVNPICGPGCPQRKDHYKLNSLFSLNYGKKYNLRDCKIDKGIFYPTDWKTIVTPEELYSEYLDKGFKYFKLEGRTLTDFDNLLSVAKYLIKPEYQFHFISLVYNCLTS